jgi:glycosyltransferase involved in cell wall biosynthesis
MSISVIIPLYNKEVSIAHTLASVLAQTYGDFEIIIIDDGSTDQSVSVVKTINDPRIRLFSYPNGGVSLARNRGIAQAQYPLIAFLDGDDAWLPNHLDEIHTLSITFPDALVYATNYTIIDSDHNQHAPVATDLVISQGSMGIINNYFDTATRTAPPVWTSATAVRREALQRIGGFPVGITLGEDLLTWARLACQGDIAYSKIITAEYHFQSFTELTTPGKKPDRVDYVGEELHKLIPLYPQDTQAITRYVGLWHRMRLNEYMKRGESALALHEMRKILHYTPKDYKSYVLLILALLPAFVRRLLLTARATLQAMRHT